MSNFLRNASTLQKIIILIVASMAVFMLNRFDFSGENQKVLQDQVETSDTTTSTSSSPASPHVEDDSEKIQHAFTQQLNDVQVQASGQVKKVLPDDNNGSRHQRFILELQTGQTILIAHNIDLAPRIEKLSQGDTVEFFGVYEYNPQGGVVHWTHHDPKGKHVDGWLKHHQQTYE